MPETAPTVLIEGDAVVLAGGLSERMGADKARLEIQGKSLLRRRVEALSRLFRRVHLSVGPGGGYPEVGAPAIPDRTRGRGPLEGVRSVLGALGAPALFVAVDQPYFSARLARALWEEALRPGRRGAVPRWSARLEPAFSVYGPALLGDLEALLAEERRDLRGLAGLPGVEVLDLDDREVLRRVFGSERADLSQVFENLNTPADLNRLLRSGCCLPPESESSPSP